MLRTGRLLAPHKVGALSFRFDAGISPHAGNQLPGTLASPRAGLTPAGCPELIARLHHDLLYLSARATGRTDYAKLSLKKWSALTAWKAVA